MSISPPIITFNPDKARAWILDEDNTELVGAFLDEEGWGTTDDLGADYADNISDLLAVLPADVLNVPAQSIQIDGVNDEYDWQCRVIVTLRNGVALAGSVEAISRFLPSKHDYNAGLLPVDDEHPQIGRLMYVIADIVRIGNSLISGLFRVLGDVAEGRAEYIQVAPDMQKKEALESEVATLWQAARIAVGDMQPLYGLLPSWRWTPAMNGALRGSPSSGPATAQPKN